MKLPLRLLLCLLLGFTTTARAQNLPQQECTGAIPVCQPSYTQTQAYSGHGITQELNMTNRGCLQSFENNDVWYTINVSSSGVLVFSISPLAPSDYDFGLWNITGGGCQTLYNGLQPTRCNFNGGTNPTGISTTPNASFGPALNVNAGETYLLNVSNFSTSQAGYLLSFAGSTASVFDTLTPKLSAASTTCGITNDTIKILLSEPVLCSSIAANGSDFQLTPFVGGVSIVSASSTSCANGGLSTQSIDLALTTALPNGNYTLTSLLGSDGNTLLDNCNNAVAVAGTVSFTIGTPPPPIYKLLRVAPCGRRALYSITPPISGIYTLDIKQGTTTLRTVNNVSGSIVDSLFPGNYTATLTSAGCSSTVAFTVVSTPPTVNFTVTPTCVNSSSGSIAATITDAPGPWTYTWNTTPVQTTATATGLPVGTYTLSADNGAGCSFTRSATITSVPGFPLSTTQTDIACNGIASGTATAVPTGGTTPYTYSWNTTPVQITATATGLGVGTYNVTVADATGCTVTASATFTQPSAITATTTTTPASCAGTPVGTATVTAGGGVGSYSYSWNTTPPQTTQTATALTQGSYTVTVTDGNGCVKTATANVPQSPPVTATATATAASCAAASNGTATVTAAAGTPPYTYSWNTTPAQTTRIATGLLPGTYTATVTDGANCTTTATATVGAGAGIGGSFTNKTQPNCFGSTNGAATFTPTGGATPYNYLWSNGQTTATATGLSAGFYSVTATDANGCARTDTFTLGQPTLLSTTVQADSVSCFGGANGTVTATPTGGTAPYSYSWNTTPVQTTAVATGLVIGNYSVTVTDAKGCTATGAATIEEPTALSVITGVQRASCPGLINGKAFAAPSGGVGPYTYQWNTSPVQTTDTAFNLLPLTYSVVVKDSKNCSLTQSVAVPGFVLTTTSTDASCNGLANGTATVTPAGGIAPYTYSWNTTPAQTDSVATALLSGTYIASVTDAGGCTITQTATVGAPAALVITPTVTAATCATASNGTATVSVSGGISPYSYSWNTTPLQATAAVTGLAVGTFMVTVTDGNGCMDTLAVAIPAGPGISGSFTQTTQPACFGDANGSAVFTPAGGATPYTYLWSNGQTTQTATGLAAGTYSVLTTEANGCSRNDTFTLAQPAALAASVSTASVSCFGGADGTATVTATGGTAPYAYSWNTTPAQTSATATGLSTGAQQVTVTDANGCVATATDTVRQPIAIAVVTGVQRASCPGLINGKAFAAPSGGTPPYTYSWNTTPVQTGDTANSLLPGPYTVTVTDFNGCTSVQTVNVPGFTLSATQTNVICNGETNGSANVVAAGGIAPYTYSWNTTPIQTIASATALGAGNYVASVTDAGGCTLTAPFAITEPLPIMATNTATAATCLGASNGTASVTVSGGTAPYTYSWNTTPVKTTAAVTGLPTGTYAVIVKDANNCTDTFSVIVPTGAGVSGSFTSTAAPNCFGSTNGLATFTPAGGTTPYTYLWSNGQTSSSATNLAAGKWSVLVTDASGCIHRDTVTLTQPTALGATVQTTPVSCFGGSTGSATVTVSGGTAPYSYSWNTTPVRTTAAVSGIAAGNYTVVITDAKGCALSQAAAISQPAALLATTGVQATFCSGSASGKAWVTVTGGNAPYTYSWNTTPVQTTDTARNLLAGTYSVVVTDSKGCNTTKTVSVINSSFSISLTQTNALCFGAANGTATVTTTGGRAPYTYSWSNGQTTSSATALGAGAYTVTVTDANGCVKTATATITEPTALTATLTSIMPNCFGGANGSVTLVASGGTAPYSYLWSNGQTTSSATNLAAGSWSVRITDSKGCIRRDTVTLTQPTILVATVQTTPVACFGGSSGTAAVTVSGGTAPYSYSWNTSPTRTTATITGMIAGTYSVTVTDAKGCLLVRTATVTQPAVLTATTGTQATLCPGGASGKAWAVPSGGNPPYTYSWNTTPTQTGDTARNLLAGPYTVIINDSKGCGITRAVNVANSAFVISLTQTNALCFGASNGTATVTATGGRAPYTYSWSSGQNTATVSTLPAGSHTVTVTDANGCTQTATATITEPTALTATTTPTDPRCFGATNGTVALVASGGTAPYTYLWSNGQTSANANGLSAGSWSVQVTDSKGCIYNTTGTLTEPAILQVTLAGTNVSCFGGTDGAVSAGVSGGTAPYTYSWNTTPVQTTQVITNLTAGTYIATVTDAQNCTGTYTTTITQPTVIAIAVRAQLASCASSPTGKAYATPTGGTPPYTYVWSSGQTDDSATGLLTGNYTVTVTDSKGCTGTQNVNVGALPGVQATVAIGKTPCVGAGDGTLNGIAANGVAPYTFSWNTTPIQTTQTATALISGAYLLTVTDATGCVDTETAVLPNLPLPIVFAGGDRNVCFGDSVRLAGSGTAVSYLWTPATALSCTTCVAPVCKPTADRRYLLTGTGANGCVNTDTAWVRVIKRHPVSVGTTQRICLGSPATLTAKGGDTYSWTPVATVNNATDSSTFAHPDTTTNYRVIIGQNNCFWDTLHQLVEVYTTPVITMPKEIPALYNTKIRLSAVVENGPFLQWTPADNLDCNSCITPIALVTGSLTYVLTASNAGGCEATGYVDIITNCDPQNYFIPTGFTPDGDGENRWFFPKSKDPGTMRSMKIFDRWGKLMFEANGVPFNSAQAGWDGRHQGTPVPQGVYIYIIEAECVGGQTVKLQGDVTLLR